MAARDKLATLAALWGALGRSALYAAARVAGPLYFGIGIGAAVVFSPNGLRAADVCRAVGSSFGVRAALWAAWLIATAPVARALLSMPSTFVLRALPVPRWQHWAVHGAHLLLAELPWIALWARGSGALDAAAMGAAAAGAHALIVARPRRAGEIASAAGLAAALLLPLPAPLILVAAAGAAATGIAGAWTRAPSRGASNERARLRGVAPVALGLAYIAHVRRDDPATLTRATIFIVVGALVASLAARNNGMGAEAPALATSLAVAGAVLAPALGSIARSVHRAERRDRWVLDCLGASGAVRVLGAAGAVGVHGLALGAAFGAIASFGLGLGALGALRFSIPLAAWGVALGGLATSIVRATHRGDGRDDGRAVVALLMTAGSAVGAAGALGDRAPLAAFALAILGGAWSARTAANPAVEPRGRRRIWQEPA